MTVHNDNFFKEEIDDLPGYRDNQGDRRLKIRFVALRLKAKGTAIAGVVGKPSKDGLHRIISKGIDRLNSFGYKPKKYFCPMIKSNNFQNG